VDVLLYAGESDSAAAYAKLVTAAHNGTLKPATLERPPRGSKR